MKRKPNIHLLYEHVVVFINPFHFLNSWIILYHPMQIKKSELNLDPSSSRAVLYRIVASMEK